MFSQLTQHIWCRPYQHKTDRPNIGWIGGREKALLFDAGNSGANAAMLREELMDAVLKMPDYVALSHWHWDHTFGASFWGVPVIAGRQTDAQLRKMANWRWDDASMAERISRGEDIVFCTEMIKLEYPDRSQIRVTGADIAFDGALSLDLGGGVVCHLIHAEGPHSSDSVICYVPCDRFVFLSDSDGKDLYDLPWEFDIHDPDSFRRATDALPYDWDKVDAYLELLEGLDFTHCINGHGDLMTREMLFDKFRKCRAQEAPEGILP